MGHAKEWWGMRHAEEWWRGHASEGRRRKVRMWKRWRPHKRRCTGMKIGLRKPRSAPFISLLLFFLLQIQRLWLLFCCCLGGFPTVFSFLGSLILFFYVLPKKKILVFQSRKKLLLLLLSVFWDVIKLSLFRWSTRNGNSDD